MKKLIPILFITIFIIPSVALASWWNPFSWSVFHKTKVVPAIQVETQKTPEEKITELQKQIDNLKGQQPSSSIAPKTPVVEKKVTPKISAPIPTEPTPAPALDYSKYTNPITGKVLTPKEYADIVAPYGINPVTNDYYTLKEILVDGVANSKKDITPYINLKVNDQDGPITVNVNSLVNVSWTSANVVSCSGSTNNKPLNGRETIQIDNNTTSPFTIRCLTSNGIIVSDSVVLNITGKTSGNYDDYDIYKVSVKSGIPYTAKELNAIDCAYYGRSCPTIDVRILNQ